MRQRKHCDYYIQREEPVYKLHVGDCAKPVNGRFQPRRCKEVCSSYVETAYKMKQALTHLLKETTA